MQRTVLLTVIGRDRPGLTEILAGAVLSAGGNWLESTLARLGGNYVGAVLVRVDADTPDRLEAAVRAIDPAGLRVAVAPAEPEPEPAGQPLRLELVGGDRPGIVREVSAVLARYSVNILTLETRVENASFSGGALFRAEAELMAPAGLAVADLSAALERISAEMMADIALRPPAAG